MGLPALEGGGGPAVRPLDAGAVLGLRCGDLGGGAGCGGEARVCGVGVVGRGEFSRSLCLLSVARIADLCQIYLIGNVKAFLTIVKYAPQSWLNYRRKSTRGLSITMFTLDLVGAILSIVQLVIDSAAGGDWSAVLANPAKFALGNVTIFFDVLSLYQHYYLYRGVVDDGPVGGEVEPLISSSEEP